MDKITVLKNKVLMPQLNEYTHEYEVLVGSDDKIEITDEEIKQYIEQV